MKGDLKPDIKRDVRAVDVIEHDHHPLFPPSGAHRWLYCTASPQPLSRGYQGQVTESSAEGTLAHTVFADWLTKGEPAHELGQVYECEGYRFRFDEEMHTALAECIDFIHAPDLGVVQLEQVEVLTRAAIYYSADRTPQEVTGHADVVQLVTQPDGSPLLRVSDLKYGKGVRVFAESNPQLMLYALGMLHVLEHLLPEDMSNMYVELNVLQPRLEHFDSWMVSAFDLFEWGATVVAPAVAEVHGLGAGPTFRPHADTCRWCPLKGECEAARELVVALFDDSVQARVNDDSNHVALGLFLEQLPYFEQVAKAARERAQTLLMNGEVVPGWKLVAGRSARGWDPKLDELELADALRAHKVEPFTRVLTSVAAAEKVLGRAVFTSSLLADMVVKPEGRPTLAPESDKRPAAVPADGSIFNDDEASSDE